jgi:hypothetical protein
MLPHETNSSDLEEAWPIFGVKLEVFVGSCHQPRSGYSKP